MFFTLCDVKTSIKSWNTVEIQVTNDTTVIFVEDGILVIIMRKVLMPCIHVFSMQQPWKAWKICVWTVKTRRVVV